LSNGINARPRLRAEEARHELLQTQLPLRRRGRLLQLAQGVRQGIEQIAERAEQGG